MAKVVEFNQSAKIIAKEFKKAFDDITLSDGKVIKAQPDRYYFYLACGKYRDGIIVGEPLIKIVQVSKEIYDNVTSYVTEDLVVTILMVDSLESRRTKITEVEQFSIIVREEE